MEERLLAAARAATGFRPDDEGLFLYQCAQEAARNGPLLEVGSYCGKSTVYLGAAARLLGSGRVVFAVDHHRGSEENQPGWEWHEPDLVDRATGMIDTLPWFRSTVHDAGLEEVVVAVVGRSPVVAAAWSTPLAFLFIDGGHGVEPARADYAGWTPHVAPGGLLAVHDVFPDPADGGRPPYEEIYLPARRSGRFEDVSSTGSLRIMRAVGDSPTASPSG